ncbi:hypothetical protein FSP39_001092 [Pinctada imbricata]|uniref:Uncharacterized protein n=1 Tax=Pinctada imbricata TaxID=66713 RepID=A0AA89C2Y9_PINIB|nr:hypothetical protein FSP39_001092 [Pinctada imbricata]
MERDNLSMRQQIFMIFIHYDWTVERKPPFDFQPKPKKPPPPSTVPGAKTMNKPPEKPPEPVQKPLSKPAEPVQKLLSKPEKSPEPAVPEQTHTDKLGHHDKHKKKDHPTDTDKQTPPALPGKKPVLPPPVGKKPTKPDPPRPSSMHEAKVDEDHHTDSKLMSHSMIEGLENKSNDKKGFEALEPSTEKLRHLTANRAKGPINKRPPSTVIFNNEEERNGDVKDSHWIKEEKERHTKKLPTPPVADIKEEAQPVKEKPSTAPSRPPEPTIAPAVFQSAIEELRKELRELKANTVSKAAFEELKSENEKLKQDVETLKSSYSKKIRDLTNEVDDEKKIRLNTQVEIERIRKLVNESHV